jgi:hypothetical protein
LIQRSYRDDVAPSHIERFLPLILDMEEDNVQVTPCFTSEGINYMHIRISNLYSQSALPHSSCRLLDLALRVRLRSPSFPGSLAPFLFLLRHVAVFDRQITDLRSPITPPCTCLWNVVLALSKRNSNAAEIIIFLHRLASVLTEYFKELEEESIRDNFVIVYELLDEMMDFGFPQTTESKILQE